MMPPKLDPETARLLMEAGQLVVGGRLLTRDDLPPKALAPKPFRARRVKGRQESARQTNGVGDV